MKRFILCFTLVVIALYGIAKDPLPTNNYSLYFDNAYASYPDIPRGVLEAVAFTNTRFQHLTGNEPESCFGLPQAYGVMGLIYDGKGYFRSNLEFVASVSGQPAKDIGTNPSTHIMAYAKAYHLASTIFKGKKPFKEIVAALSMLSEIPMDDHPQNEFALNSFIYSVFAFLNNKTYSKHYGFPEYNIDLESIFGDDLKVLSADKVIIDGKSITNGKGDAFVGGVKSLEYGPAIWTPAPSCNYSSRNGIPVSAITIHTIQGSYAGAISWAQNCNSNVSYHYVIRSSDGQVTQMVLEADKAWHVGSENPYTIGYEHEGYVNDPSWYTTAMYNSSSDLSRDVVNSGYGINPLRTYYGASSSGTNTLGGCTKIKGHQHYPNQSHTDPGINWDWERYYKLINNNPTITPEPNASGNFYDSGGAGSNYSDDERILTLIQPTGATSVTITFNSFDLENNWDYLYIYNGTTPDDPLVGIYTGTNNPGTITSNNGALLFEFRSDCATTAPGWEAVWTSNANPPPTDNTPPTTVVNASGNWFTTNFMATFTDDDNQGGSGLEQSYYQVIDFDGTEWRANANNGFFSDNFDAAIHPDWTLGTGTWGINNAYLEQTNEVESNTNIYATLNQGGANRYLYHWAGMINGSGTNKRAGFHFFSDDGSLPNRGNSYFVWFREDDDKLQFYKVVNDVFSLEADIPYTFNANQWYDIKVIYDRNTGKTDVYIDNVLAGSWTDASPYTTGNYISFRSGNCIYTVNDLKVYQSRSAAVTVTVGSGSNNDLRYQNPNPLTPAGRIKSIVADSAGNLSSIGFHDINIDWTAPFDVVDVNDGVGADIDTTTTNTELAANWLFSADMHSDIARYWYAIGSTAGDSDVVAWTDNWFADSMVHTGLSLSYGNTYYISVRSENGAGLWSNIASSDGIYVDQPTAPPVANYSNSLSVICEGDSIYYANNSTNASSYEWIFQGGLPATSTNANPAVYYGTSGTYDVTLIATGPGGTDTLVQQLTVDVALSPTASFSASDTTVYLPNAIITFTNNSNNANGYHWDFDDSNSSNDTNPWHQYTAIGTYNVMLIAVNGNCPNDTTYLEVYVDDATGISTNSNPFGIVLYPNPITDQSIVSYQLKQDEMVEIKLVDAQGRSLLLHQQRQTAGAHQFTINATKLQLAQGLYLLQFNTGKASVTQQMVVK